jgi:asparagine synthase (glutamine-hydrolysing)
MCGIAGIMMADGGTPDPAVLDRMKLAMCHRGPDGSGRHVRDNVGLVHARLAIIDLATGDQPLYGPRGCALIANAEIYNDLELRTGELAGERFLTRSDCEPVLQLYERHDIDCPTRLRGMYAFAIYDPERQTILIARDPFGIKPLYYVETPRFFAFASEPQALVASGLVEPELTPSLPEELLQLQLTTGARTMFQGIMRVLPGEALRIKAGRIVERKIVSALPAAPPLKICQSAALEQLDAALLDSVKVHQRSDVPYGLFLSSGIDSAAVLACMTRLSNSPVIAYTASFPESRLADEYPQAHRVARAMGARHINVEITERAFWTHLPKIAACVDDPTADYAVVPTYLLAREAAKEVKVVLCGEGGDEIFAGYGRYRRQARPWWLGGRQRHHKVPFTGTGILRHEPLGWRRGIDAAEAASTLPGRSPLQVMQAADCVDFLPHGLLTKLDRCLMAHGLEGRTPFLDPVIAQLGFLLPQRLKIGRHRGKYLLRRWLEEHLPEAAPYARKKGFTVPVGEWIGRVGDRLGPLVAADPAIAALCIPERVKQIFTSGGKHDRDAAWRLLFYALWHRRHIRGLQPEGDVFDCLAARAGFGAEAAVPELWDSAHNFSNTAQVMRYSATSQ